MSLLCHRGAASPSGRSVGRAARRRWDDLSSPERVWGRSGGPKKKASPLSPTRRRVAARECGARETEEKTTYNLTHVGRFVCVELVWCEVMQRRKKMREAVWEKQSGVVGGVVEREEIVDFWGETRERKRRASVSLLVPFTAAARWGVEIRHRQSKQKRAGMGRPRQPANPVRGGTGGPCVPSLVYTIPDATGDRGVARRARPLSAGTRGDFSVGEREWARDPLLLVAISHHTATLKTGSPVGGKRS